MFKAPADRKPPVKTYRTTVDIIEMATGVEQIAEAVKSAIVGIKSLDLGPAAMIETFKGDGTGPSVKDFFEQVENASILGGWKPQFRVTVVRLKVRGAAETFLTTKFDFSKIDADGLPEVKYEDIKNASIERFSSKKTEQFNYMALQSATQRRDESVEVFAERIRKLGVKTMSKSDDPATQAVIEAEANKRMLAAFLHGLSWKVGEVARFAFPKTFDKALEMAIMAEMEEQSHPGDADSNVFAVTCYECNEEGHIRLNCPKKGMRSASPNTRVYEGGRLSERRNPSSWGRREFVGSRGSFSGNRGGYNSNASYRGGRGTSGSRGMPYRGRGGSARGMQRSVRFDERNLEETRARNASFRLAKTVC